MKSEYINIPGWKEWYDGMDVNHDEETLLKGIVDMRNRSLKTNPLKVKEEYIVNDGLYSYNINDDLTPYIGKKVRITIFSKNTTAVAEIQKNQDETLILKGILNKIYTVQEFKNKEILQICEDYLDLLKGIINACMNKFG